jgi:cysteine desulfurase/selenocysteine lyase
MTPVNCSKVDWNAVRREFPSLDNRNYLNTATFGQLPTRAADAAHRHLKRRERNACADFLDWFTDLDPLRASIARLIGAQTSDIAFMPNASSALALAISSVDWQPGDEMLTLREEFPNQLYAHAVAGVRGVECEWHELESQVNERTRLVLLSTVNYSTGLRPDLGATVARLKAHGVIVYLDGTQSIGALRFDCSAIQPDFLAVDAYKWMISPNGAAFVYVHPERQARLRPNVIGWRSDREWRNVNSLHKGSPRFGDSAEKYEPGMLPFLSLYGMAASCQLLEELGADVIEARILELVALLRAGLLKIGAEFEASPGPCLPSQIVLARFPDSNAAKLAEALAARGIYTSARKGCLRISPHFYNSEEDIAELLAALRDLTAGAN